MGTVHQLIEEHGRQGALSFDEDRKVIEIATDYMAYEDPGIGFLYSGVAFPWMMTKITLTLLRAVF